MSSDQVFTILRVYLKFVLRKKLNIILITMVKIAIYRLGWVRCIYKFAEHETVIFKYLRHSNIKFNFIKMIRILYTQQLLDPE